MRYDPEADVLTVVISEGGRLSHAEEVGDIVLHLDEKDRPLFIDPQRQQGNTRHG